jgi:hypothetical protein
MFIVHKAMMLLGPGKTGQEDLFFAQGIDRSNTLGYRLGWWF